MVGLRKIIGDLRNAWGRVLLLIVAVAVGQSAMTASYSAQIVIGREIIRNVAMASPQDAMVEVTGFDPAGFDRLAPIPGVARMDMMVTLGARYQLRDGTLLPIILSGRRDFEDLRALRVFPQAGTRPPRAGEVLIERSGLSLLEASQGEAIRIVFGEGQSAMLRFAGSVHDPMQAPSYQENALYGYTGLETLAGIAGPRPIQLLLFAEPGTSPAEAARATADAMSALGAQVVRVVPTAPTHPHGDLMNGLLLLLTGASVLSFAVALFVSASIISSLTQSQERQIAVLRALGASRFRIALLHLGFALTPALVGLFSGAALGAYGARVVERTIAWQLNLTIESSAIPAAAELFLLLTGAVGILLAIAIPVTSSVRKPVRQALQGASPPRSRPWLRISVLPPLEQMAFVEAFRRPLRTSVTVLSLMLAGAGFIASANTYASLMGIIDGILADQPEDITTTLSSPPDLNVLRAGLDRIGAVRHYEIWDSMRVTVSSIGAASDAGVQMPLINPSRGSEIGYRDIQAGRAPTGAGEIVIGELAAKRAAMRIGSRVTLGAGGRTTDVTVVGVFNEWGASIWTNEATYARLAAPGNRAREIRAIVDPNRYTEASIAMERAVLDAGSFPTNSTTRAGFRTLMSNHFLNFLQFLLVACLTAALVGGVALSAAVGSNVLERTREIGVLRTLGATTSTTFRLVLGQSLSLTMLCLALAIAASFPLSEFGLGLLQRTALPATASLVVSWAAIGVLAAVFVALAVLASIAPAIRINAMPIRTAIAYE